MKINIKIFSLLLMTFFLFSLVSAQSLTQKIVCYDDEELQIYCQVGGEEIDLSFPPIENKQQQDNYFDLLDSLIYIIPITLLVLVVSYVVYKKRSKFNLPKW